MALQNLGVSLAGTGDVDAALQATREANDIYLRLAQAEPSVHLPDLASASQAFASVRVASGLELNEALTAAERAVTIYQSLKADQPATFVSRLQAAQDTLAQVLQSTGQGKGPGQTSNAPDRASPGAAEPRGSVGSRRRFVPPRRVERPAKAGDGNG